MSRLARRRGHAGSCPTRLGRGAIRGAAKKQTPTRAPRQRVARIWRSCASDARWRDCRAGLARDLPSRAPRDAPWRTRRRRSSTQTSWRAPPRRRGRSGTRPSCLCAHGRDCASRPYLAALSSRERETRRSPGRVARVYWSTRSTSALADETAKRFRGRDFLNPERRVRASRPSRKGAFTSERARDDRSGNSVIWYPRGIR